VTERLPGGGNAWFVRYRKGMSYQLTPCSKEGWAVIAAFVVVNLLSVLILIPEPTLLRLVVWGTVEVIATVLLIIVAFRTSAPGWREH
jgi:hypothetical protein